MASKRFTYLVAVHAFFIQDDKILLCKRANTGYLDGWYSVPAGHMDGGETVAEAMARELREEVGIEIEPTALPDPVHVMHRTRPGIDERIDYFYVLQDWPTEPYNAEPEKCSEVAWFELSELPKKIAPYIRFSLQNIQSRKHFSEYIETQ